MKAKNGMSVVSVFKPDLSSATVIAVSYVISWYIGPRYNGTFVVPYEKLSC